MNKKTLRIVAGAVFALNGVLRLITLLSSQGSTTAWSYIWPIAYLLIAVSLFADIPLLTTVGGLIVLISPMRSMIQMGCFIPYLFLNAMSVVLLSAAGLSRRTSNVFGILSAIFFAFYEIVLVFVLNAKLAPMSYLYIALYLVGVILLGIGFSEKGKKVVASSKDNGNDRIERLTKLKELLDKGVLTPEEFEEKKRQLLGQ